MVVRVVVAGAGTALVLLGAGLVGIAELTELEATHVNLRALVPGTGDAVYVRSTVVGAGLAAMGVFLLGVAFGGARRRAARPPQAAAATHGDCSGERARAQTVLSPVLSSG
jgi:hypothetical protein